MPEWASETALISVIAGVSNLRNDRLSGYCIALGERALVLRASPIGTPSTMVVARLSRARGTRRSQYTLAADYAVSCSTLPHSDGSEHGKDGSSEGDSDVFGSSEEDVDFPFPDEVQKARQRYNMARGHKCDPSSICGARSSRGRPSRHSKRNIDLRASLEHARRPAIHQTHHVLWRALSRK